MELEPASFTLDFQPYGIRLVCEKPLTLLDAARQVGVPLRADCGGEGVCGKCRVQILSAHKSLAHSEAEEAHISKENLEQGFHLACETVISEDASIFIPTASVIEDQILQLEGCDFTADPDPVITQQMLTLEKAVLDDLAPDLERIRRAAGNINLFADLPSLRTLPRPPSAARPPSGSVRRRSRSRSPRRTRRPWRSTRAPGTEKPPRTWRP